jgi:hypothetical protein
LPADPERAIALAAYPVTDHPMLNDVVVGVQFRIRGTTDPRVSAGVADAVYGELHGLRGPGLQVGGIDVRLVARQSGTQLGPDQTGRDERTENYYIHAARPTPGRLD